MRRIRNETSAAGYSLAISFVEPPRGTLSALTAAPAEQMPCKELALQPPFRLAVIVLLSYPLPIIDFYQA